ncbi:hypothetical protein EVAR_3243_1 [Eumeta japonica]|uniref:Uncharacterized protein n=1 Tax=Eumeta variegata TaxID=151549 RepID=A0A4C1SXI4_EUMVA|nr:hypothetical protein EVAR_3243_1 [Eumeta japonica]
MISVTGNPLSRSKETAMEISMDITKVTIPLRAGGPAEAGLLRNAPKDAKILFLLLRERTPTGTLRP